MIGRSALEPSPEELERALSHRDAFYEIVDGKIVEKPPTSIRSRWLALQIYDLIRDFVRARNPGWAGHELMFILDPARPLCRQPDVSFVSYGRWPADREWDEEGEWPVVPDLAIEIVSPHDRQGESAKKIREYFRYGVRQLWMVQPETCEITVYRSPKKMEGFDGDDVIDGGDVLPGFQVRVSDLFAKPNR
jgi:Uma2 family endonuclease